MKTSEVKCKACDEIIDTENDMSHATLDGSGEYCEPCYDSHLQYGSTVMLYGPDYVSDSKPIRILVTEDFAVETQYFEDWTHLKFDQRYVSTNAWRGYSETKIDGWTEIVDGWTTGWPDETVARKVDFNDWVEGLATGEVVPPVNLAVIFDPTSNVFSTAVGVHVADDDVETATAWLNGELDNLRYALT